jgi:hypothetical protein
VSVLAAAEPPGQEGRSGCCYEETYPRMHQLCRGSYTHLDGVYGVSEIRRCSCRCHVVGVEALRMPSGQHARLARPGRWRT